MHMILRTILVFLKRWSLKPMGLSDKSVVTMRVLPTDLDFLWHVNNGVYFSYMDFGRWDMIFRNGIYKIFMKKGWYSVVAGETIKFRKSLQLWDKFQIETQTVGHDDKYFFVEQKFFSKGELMATGLVKIRVLRRKGGTVPIAEVLDCFRDQSIPNNAEELSRDWFGLEKKYLV
jgi:YbgC/YbaW family acyl-CoA thioester hydrolase